MTTPSSAVKSSQLVYLSIGIAVGLVAGVLIAVALQPPSTSPSTSTKSSPPPEVGTPTVFNHTGLVADMTNVTTSPISVANGSLLFVFVSYYNLIDGGGSVAAINDSLGDAYLGVTTTGFETNHTQSLYLASPMRAASDLTVSVEFTGGDTIQGGSVAVVDVTNATLPSIVGVAQTAGDGPTALLTMTTSHAGDLFLLGAAGRGVSGPYSPGVNETLLDTGTATSGPFADGTGFGTVSTTSSKTSVTLSATLNTPTGWTAIGVALQSKYA